MENLNWISDTHFILERNLSFKGNTINYIVFILFNIIYYYCICIFFLGFSLIESFEPRVIYDV